MAPRIDSLSTRQPASSQSSVTSSASSTKKRPASESWEPATSKKTKTVREPKLKQSKKPNWDRYVLEAPATTNAQKCIRKWNLVAPFDPRITEKQWHNYYEERSALEKRNTPGTEEYKALKWKELMQRADRLLKRAHGNVAGVVMGSCMENKAEIARAIEGSLYYLEIWGCEENGSDDSEGRTEFMPRDIITSTRLYSPFGIGTSVDYKYHYYNHNFQADQQYAAFVMRERGINNCTATNPFECVAGMKGRGRVGPPAAGSTRLFHWDGGKSTNGPTADSLLNFEAALFTSSGWISPRATFNLLRAAGTAGIYQERTTWPMKSLQDKFKLFDGELEGIFGAERI